MGHVALLGLKLAPPLRIQLTIKPLALLKWGITSSVTKNRGEWRKENISDCPPPYTLPVLLVTPRHRQPVRSLQPAVRAAGSIKRAVCIN